MVSSVIKSVPRELKLYRVVRDSVAVPNTESLPYDSESYRIGFSSILDDSVVSSNIDGLP